MLQAWQAGDRQGALELIPDSLLEELLVFGSRQECVDKIEAYCRQGVTIPVLLLLAVGQTPEEQGEMALRMLKELARP
jgi:alkanesulfonate monooxygenase SsuD/methylene tetrahydromethanopterin reductase-like flavin-dependent oxidoreductase (luciferase family)